jgi:hypothetical protein
MSLAQPSRERLPLQRDNFPDESHTARRQMRDYTASEKRKITAGAVAALVIAGWAVVLAIAFLSAR